MPQAEKLILIVLTLRQCFSFCSIDGVSAATGPSPASEEAVEVCKDEGMRTHTTSKNHQLMEDHLDFVHMRK